MRSQRGTWSSGGLGAAGGLGRVMQDLGFGGEQGVERGRVSPRSVHTRAVTVTHLSADTPSPCKLFTSDLEVFATGQCHAQGVRRARA